MTSGPGFPAYIVAARRSALGRVGGLHRNRRIEDLTAPVLMAALEDCGLPPDRVDEVIIGNASAGGNPARLIALASGIPEAAAAATVDRQCGSGLDAILNAARLISLGEAGVIVAGGAESISTAPWRIAKPKSIYQTPHFIGLEPAGAEAVQVLPYLEAGEAMARALKIGRAQQDAYAIKSFLKAERARDARRFVGEIVPLKANAEEARDQSAVDTDPDEVEQQLPFQQPDGTLTPSNTSALHDGAAIVVVVSEAVWRELGAPPALKLVAGATQGVAHDREGWAPIAAVTKLYAKLNGQKPQDIGLFEVSETSAAQAIAVAEALGLDDGQLNPDGGAIVRGHPLGASGAVLVVRLFTRMVRSGSGKDNPRFGVAAQGAAGGMGLAALFEAV
jgi:acetyl-CoA C-acetyltransferase